MLLEIAGQRRTMMQPQLVFIAGHVVARGDRRAGQRRSMVDQINAVDIDDVPGGLSIDRTAAVLYLIGDLGKPLNGLNRRKYSIPFP